MPQCQRCKKQCFNRHVFRGKWICIGCYVKQKRIRDNLYYKALQEATRVK